MSLSNLISSTGVVANDVTGVGSARSGVSAARYGTDKAIFGYGNTGNGSWPTAVTTTNLVSNTGVITTSITQIGTSRYQLAAAGYSS